MLDVNILPDEQKSAGVQNYEGLRSVIFHFWLQI